MSRRISVVVGGEGSGLAFDRSLRAARAAAPEAELLLAPAFSDDPRRAPLFGAAARRVAARLVSVPRGGSWREAGAQASSGELLMWLPAGMRPDPGFAAAALERLEADPGLDFVTAWIRLEHRHDDERVAVPPERDAIALLTRPDAAPRLALLRRSAWQSAGGFRSGTGELEEWDFWIAVVSGGRRGACLEAALGASPAAPPAPPPDAAALDALFQRHREACERDPAALLAEQERAIRRLVPLHAALAARRLVALGELERLEREIEALEAARPADDAVDWGELGRPVPLSRDWGLDRGPVRPGLPVDRHYIERFLEECAGDVRGAVLEVQEDDYTRRFGGERVTRSDVVDVDPANSRATLLADLSAADGIADDSYDCFILTQTLHVLADAEAAVAEAFRILKPGGVLLATLPCASRACLEYGADGDFWRVTEAGARRLFGRVFPEGAVETRSWGNALSSAAFLYGAAAAELTGDQLEAFDPYLPLLVSVRAVKPGAVPAPAPPGARRRVRARLGPVALGSVVLRYHRVAEPATDVHRLCVSPADFEEQVEALREEWDPLPLDELAAAAADGRAPRGAVAVTLDDGYRDALEHASPVLCACGVPATFFVIEAALEDPLVFWWDLLERVLLRGAPLPERLVVDAPGGRLDLPVASAEERQRAHQSLYPLLRGAGADERRRLLEALVAWSGVPSRPADADRPLAPDELRRLAARPGHAIGAHTRNHLDLSQQDERTLRDEVILGRQGLEARLGRAVEGFAYPHGFASEAAVAAVTEAGFRWAVTCEARRVGAREERLRLPRVEVRPGGREAFRRWLRAWMTESDPTAT